MKSGDMLFVFGTLRLGQISDLSKSMAAQFIETSCINGSLALVGTIKTVRRPIFLGHKPDFKASQPCVEGDVFRLHGPNIIAHLDAYSLYPAYSGRCLTVTESGRKVWVYCHKQVDDEIPATIADVVAALIGEENE